MIAHEQPVAHVQAVAVERQGQVLERVRDEQRNDLLRVLVRPEVVRRAADEDRKAVGGEVRIGEAIGRRLARGIGVRGHQGVGLATAPLRDAAVDLVRRDLHERLHLATPRRLQERVGAEDVGADEPLGLADGSVDVRLGREIEDQIHAALGRLLDVLRRGDVAAQEAIARVVLHRLEIRQIAGVGQLVEDRDVPVGMGGEGMADIVGADEPGATGDEDARHRVSRSAPSVSRSFSRARADWRETGIRTCRRRSTIPRGCRAPARRLSDKHC